MTDYLMPEPAHSGTAANQSLKAGAETDLDTGSRSWRKRLASIRESPFRVVFVACFLFYLAMLGVAVASIISQGDSLSAMVWQIPFAAGCLAFLMTIIGLVIYPVVWFWRWVGRSRGRANAEGQEFQRTERPRRDSIVR